MSLSPKELQDVLDELEASRASRKRAWENLQEIRWVLKDTAGVELPLPKRKTIDLEGRIVKDGVRRRPSPPKFVMRLRRNTRNVIPSWAPSMIGPKGTTFE